MKRVLFDTDVLLDILAQRQPFVVASAQALNTVMTKQVQGFVSGHGVTNIFYILRRQIGNEVARKLIENLLLHIQIASVTDTVIHQALRSSIKDFEDAVTVAAAINANLEIIITRNKSDFILSPLPVMLPEEFLEIFSE
ncbi:putative nucleic-acid-binding protein, contains PIN domain [Nostoc sp. PCC 7524]|uniref:PIN domain-containing protein n=1 Tax=Nostoc sp. (strain ATCC 29411 / PCC 7524) TaxID=28072 RepID=UPI00029EE94F|nr:PIN domain-containing protein [Nostoc sp. PCC 7524]AFY47891.1 putative nucleic-acid-binding protein, contains PIN domain [Nostoc sp. PCC 7524]